MSRLNVVRERSVTVYECDSPDCHNLCEEGLVGADCGWIRYDDYRDLRGTPTGFRYADTKWFCSYTCLGAFAYARACEAGESWCRSATPPSREDGRAA